MVQMRRGKGGGPQGALHMMFTKRVKLASPTSIVISGNRLTDRQINKRTCACAQIRFCNNALCRQEFESTGNVELFVSVFICKKWGHRSPEKKERLS